MNLELIRAYCAKDLNGILKPRDWSSTPASRWYELENQILFKHRMGTSYLEPRQLAAAVCLSALEMMDVPFQANENNSEFTETDSREAVKATIFDAWRDYMRYLTQSDAAPLVAGNAPAKQVNAMKKAALIAELEYEWSSIEADISDATRNGLKAAAHTGKHGEWDRDKARVWAVSKGKIRRDAPVHGLAAAWSGIVTRNTIGDR